MAHDEKSIILPANIVSPTDIARLEREIESIDNYFREQEIRKSGESNSMPVLSKLADQLSADNQMNLLDTNDRAVILQVLESLHKSAPVLHISFSVDPPGAYVQKIVAWLRSNIHQHALVTVGLQPNIGAGCVVRTTNKLFDFSLRRFFSEKRQFFIDKMHIAIMEDETASEKESVDQEPQAVAVEVVPVEAEKPEAITTTSVAMQNTTPAPSRQEDSK